jgi:hypothetical protein
MCGQSDGKESFRDWYVKLLIRGGESFSKATGEKIVLASSFLKIWNFEKSESPTLRAGHTCYIAADVG